MAAAPVLLLAAGGIDAAGTAMSAVSAYQQAGSQADAQKYNAKVAASEATTVRQQATGAEGQERARARDFLGNAVATSAETGVGLSGGRAQVLGQSAEDAEYQTLLTRYKGKLDAQGLTAQSALLRTQAKNTMLYGKEALFTGLVSAGAKGLSSYGASQLGPQAQLLETQGAY